MSVESSSLLFHTYYVNYPIEMTRKCPLCGSSIDYKYPNAGHQFTDFSGKFREIRQLYICTNSNCSMASIPFNPSPSLVLPHKRFSLAIWRWIATEAKIYKQNPAQITHRLHNEFGVNISENTVRNCINEIDVHLSRQIDLRTMDIVSQQGKVLIAFDGQESDKAGPSLWLFVDVISNRVLHVALLDHANHEILYGVIELILKKYKVSLLGFVSDKQGSIVKMRDTFYPEIPHQFCQFHFLQNMWKHLEKKDSSIYTLLRKSVKSLYIVNTSVKKVKKLPDGTIVSVREFFSEVAQDFEKLLKNRTTKFKSFRGVKFFERLEHYINEMKIEIVKQNKDDWITKKLKKTVSDIEKTLDSLRELHNNCIKMWEFFKKTQKTLGDDIGDKSEKIKRMDKHFNTLWNKCKGHKEICTKANIKSILPSKSTEIPGVMQEWVRLYERYRRGLFAYYDFPMTIRTNSQMEQAFSVQKSFFFGHCRRKIVGDQVRIRGGFRLKLIYAGTEEVEEIIKKIADDYSRSIILEGLVNLQERISAESKRWSTEDMEYHFSELWEK